MTATAEIALHQAFRVALTAMSRPAKTFELDGATDTADATRLIVDASWDADAQPTIVAGAPAPGSLLDLPTGTEEEPELGATVIVMVDETSPYTDVRVSGPGVRAELATKLPLSPSVLADREQACANRPLGIDMLLIGPGIAVCGIPRTTRIEVAS